MIGPLGHSSWPLESLSPFARPAHLPSIRRHCTLCPCGARIYFFSGGSSLVVRIDREQPRIPEGQLSWDSDCLYACGFRIYFTPLPGFFSPFPHGTGALSVDYEYLALEDGPPIFRQDFTCPALLNSYNASFRLQDFHFLRCSFPDYFYYLALYLMGCSLFARHY